MSSGCFLVQPGAHYELIDGRVLRACLDDDPGGVVFASLADAAEYVLRPSHHGDGSPCTMLVARTWRPGSPGVVARLGRTAVLSATDWTLDDLREVVG